MRLFNYFFIQLRTTLDWFSYFVCGIVRVAPRLFALEVVTIALRYKTFSGKSALLLGGTFLLTRNLSMAVILVVSWSVSVPSHAQTGQQRLDTTGQLIVDSIKDSCKQRYPSNEQEFRQCAIMRYDAMKAFFTKLYHYRDTKGIRSDEFKKGLSCVEKASPMVQEPGRQVAIERADWIKANDCYESALR